MNLRKTVEEVDQKYHTRKVVLVDEHDSEIGETGLVEAHRDLGKKHRAFSLQLYRIVDGKKELLLQQRAVGKPIFPYYWANTCCYNMAPGERYIERAISRVKEEMGVEIIGTILKELYKFSYYAPDVEGWCENELDNVIVGRWSGKIELNPEEAMDGKWVEWNALLKDIENYPGNYAPWFKILVKDDRFRQIFE